MLVLEQSMVMKNSSVKKLRKQLTFEMNLGILYRRGETDVKAI